MAVNGGEPDHGAIFRQEPARYDRLVAREDVAGRILPALRAIRPLAGLDMVELGAGTGRLTALLAPLARRLFAADASPAMLAYLRDKATRAGGWGAVLQLAVADHRALPLPAAAADLIVAGWSIGYLAGRPDGMAALDRVLAEMTRLLRSGGTIIVLETLGTGYTTPQPPEHLRDYYRHLARAGFASRWIRTDYRFASLAEAEELVRFFFGEELANRVVRERLISLPECTGLWWRHG